jgi:predicted permease
MRRFRERLLNLLRVRRLDDDLAREIEAHLRLLQDDYEARGRSPEAARRAARLALGNVEHVKEQHRAARSFAWIEDARRDAAHGLRLLRRSPVFTATAALSLAIGIGANTAIFTVANALLFRPPSGIADPSALVVIGTARGDGGLNPLAYADLREVSRRATALGIVFAEEMFPHVMALAAGGPGNAEAVLGQYVTPSYFRALGALPFRGRFFAEGEEAAGVLDHDYWRRRFGGDDALVGRMVRINGKPLTIVGVASPDFRGTGIQQRDVWLVIGARDLAPRSVMGGARVRPDVSFEAAAAELRTVGQALDRERGRRGAEVRPLGALPFSRAGGNRNVVGGFAAALMLLVSLVLAVACANVAGILLARGTARAREIAVRAALGAGRGRLVRQLLTETTVLFLCGGLLGIGLARVCTHLAMRLLPPLPTSIVVPLALDGRVLLFALSLSVGAALLFGVLPAFRGARVEAGPWLKEGLRSSSGRVRLRSAFVVGQIACSALLVVLGASFVRVLRQAGAVAPGFEARGVEVATLDLSAAAEPMAAPAAFWARLIDRVRQMPAVEVASLARVPPGGWEGIGLGGVAAAEGAGAPEMFSPAWNIVETGYFAALRIPLREGRDFAPGDTAGASPVCVLDEALARRLWPGQSAIGKPLRLPPIRAGDGRLEGRLATVVGVVADIRSSSLIDGLAEPYVYLPLAQSEALGMTGQMSIVARRRGEADLAAAMALLVHDLDPRLVLARTEPLDDAVELGLTPQRMLAAISGIMGLVALLLAAIGLYGVTAYTVALRRRELAIRLALGAPRARVVEMVCRQGTRLVAMGLALGLALGVGAGRVLSVLFYGLPAAHVPTLAGTVALFLVIGATASLLPARQAVREGWRRALQED